MHLKSVVTTALLLLPLSAMAGPPTIELAGSVQPFDNNVAVAGEADPSAIVHFVVALRMKNLARLEALNQTHQPLSPAALDSGYLPTPASYAAVGDWLTTNGITIERRHSSRLSIEAAGSVGQLAGLFDLHFARVLVGNTPYISADRVPSIPAEFAEMILGINRLQPQLKPHKLIVRGQAVPSSAPTPSPPFTPADINHAYVPNRIASTGARSITAIIIDTLPATSDLTAYWKMAGVAQRLSNITLINTSAGTLGVPTGEETLDTEMASAFAPAGKVRVYACGDLDYVDSDYEQLITDMQSGVAVSQVSMSFGGGERSDETFSEIKTENQYFATITALGASLLAASGDNGIYGNGEGAVEVLYPASDPHVTGVGATSLSFTSATTITQTGWSCTTVQACYDDGASGGGLSKTFVDPPRYQSSIALAKHRAVPDISMVGDPNTGVLAVFHGKVEQDGGTSVGAPIMAAYIGLINDTRLAAGKPLLGTLNPRLYKYLSKPTFTDITSGNNGDMAGTGFDLVTGLGTPVMPKLLHSLYAQP